MTTAVSTPNAVERHTRHIAVAFGDGHRGVFHHLWLRDNCLCAECLHPETHERVLDTFSLDPEVAPVVVDDAGDQLAIDWSDGHHTRHGLDWLRARCPCSGCTAPRVPPPRLWDAGIAGDLPELRYADVVTDDVNVGLAAFVETVWTTGFVFVRDVPKTEDALRDLARRVGHLRETNFGPDFHVETMLDPNNVAYT
ncbi:MAG: DUF971 domain-containing protein, partial [Acidimicrobiia bacterium]|nr:DUF971 domain-containing protein [Acidimicrobiia bacterium]